MDEAKALECRVVDAAVEIPAAVRRADLAAVVAVDAAAGQGARGKPHSRFQ